MFGGGAKNLTHLYKYARACAYFWGPVKRLSLQPPQEKTEKTRGGQACGARHAHGGGPARAGARTREEGPATGGERGEATHAERRMLHDPGDDQRGSDGILQVLRAGGDETALVPPGEEQPPEAGPKRPGRGEAAGPHPELQLPGRGRPGHADLRGGDGAGRGGEAGEELPAAAETAGGEGGPYLPLGAGEQRADGRGGAGPAAPPPGPLRGPTAL